jgi:hypothetical protein
VGPEGVDAGANSNFAGFSAPIAAARGEGAELFVAGLDVAASAIRVQRLSAQDEVLLDKVALSGVRWSSESELRLMPAGAGVALVWRGLRAGKLVRQLVVLSRDLVATGDVVDVPAASCATQDAFWFADGKHITRRTWSGASSRRDAPKDKDASLVCAQMKAFAVLDEDDATSVAPLDRPVGAALSALSVFKESEFGDDEQRERAEFSVGDDVGIVRLGASGAIAWREIVAGRASPLRRAKAKIGREDDVVAVEASSRIVLVVFTEEIAGACPNGEAQVRIKALRVDRTTLEESVIELDPGRCAREVGPFFTSALEDSVGVAWVERVPVVGDARAPISALAHRRVPAAGAASELTRAEIAADALVDAGCDGARCVAVMLGRKAGNSAMVPGILRAIRY